MQHSLHTPARLGSAQPRRSRLRLLFASSLVVALFASACSDDDGASPEAADPTSAGTESPEAIVSLAPTATEMLFAVGAGDRVIAVDEQSDYPDDAPVTDLSGFTPNLEAVLGYDPDLVVLTEDTGDIVTGLERAGVEVLHIPAAQTLDDTYAQIEQVGAATGNVGEAAELVSQMQGDVAEIVDTVPERETPLTYFHELDDLYYTVTDDSYIGQIHSQLGLTSIATGEDAYPQLSEEVILESDPDLVFLADAQCCGVTPESVAERPGWDGLSAVREDRVHIVDEDLASRWGPRVVDYMREIADIVSAIPADSEADAVQPTS